MIDSLYIDRRYTNAPIVDEILARRGTVVCRPWLAGNGVHFSNRDFTINMRDRTIGRRQRRAGLVAGNGWRSDRAGPEDVALPGCTSASVRGPGMRVVCTAAG